MFDILICSWNNLEYLQLTIESIKRNSFFVKYPHNIYVHVQEGTDGTIDYLIQEKINYTVSDKNIGLCKGTNNLTKFITKDWVCLIDDDMYVLPNWDRALIEFYIDNGLNYKSWLSSIMLELSKGPNTTISPVYYGDSPHNFNETKLLNDYETLYKGILPTLVSNQATPLLLRSDLWKEINGYDEAFDPGIGAEEGLAKKIWDIGGRNFVGVPNSLVYHFQCKTTKRIPAGGSNNRDEQFMKIHGITVKDFLNNYLKVRTIWEKK